MSCKRKFDSITADMIIAGSMGAKATKKRMECRKYWCSKCKAYHLTSQPLRNKDARNKIHQS